ncbi:hypothetical protein Afe04nite_83100 [Asanoa ferruginea]|nr:hypothetical protein Afe04nite_83100 [Asanoa ferruginea]
MDGSTTVTVPLPAVHLLAPATDRADPFAGGRAGRTELVRPAADPVPRAPVRSGRRSARTRPPPAVRPTVAAARTRQA